MNLRPIFCIIIEPPCEKTCLCHVNTKAQISAFVVHCLDSILLILAKSKISRLASLVAGQADLSLIWAQTPKIGFLVTWLNYKLVCNQLP